MTEEQNKLAEEIREVLEWTRALLRNIASASPEVLKHTDIEAFILNEINPALALTARLRVEREPATEAVLDMVLAKLEAVGPAHTYASENADLYRGFDNGIARAIEIVKALK